MRASVPYPTYYEQTNLGERPMDVWSKLFKNRVVYLGTPIDDSIANLIVAQLLTLESDDPDKDISLYVNSPGGEITGLFAIYDTMQFIKCDVSTICVGQAASAAAVILSAGARGKRFVLPHSRVLIHQPHGGASGQAVDIEIQAKDTDRDFIMGAEEAVAYGIVDEVITNRELAAVGVPAGVS